MRAQDGVTVGVPRNGAGGVKESVQELMDRQSRESSKQPQPPEKAPRGRVSGKGTDNPDSPRVSQWPPASKQARPNVQALTIDLPPAFDVPAQSVAVSTTPATYLTSGYIPPSPMGAVGPTQILLVINGRVRTLNKSGLWDGNLDVTSDVFFESVRNGGYTTDPRVIFDRSSQRWFVSMINVPTPIGPNRILIGVSNGPAITSGASFTFYQFQQDQFDGAPDTGFFADFPSLGVDNYALYIGVNMFDTSITPWAPKGSTGFVINKANLLAGGLTVTPFRQIGTNLGGMFAPQGVTVVDSSVSSGFFIGTDAVASGMLRIRRVINPGGIPSLAPFTLTVPSTARPLPVAAPGSTLPLDTVDERLMNAQIINGSLWTTHSIRVNSSGVGLTAGDRNAMRFYEITNLDTVPTLRQSGTLYDAATSNPLHYWVGSMATSGQGHTAVASSYAGNTAFAGVAFDGRLSGDALGSLNPTINRTLGAAAYNLQPACSPNCFQRWGDYSNTVVDPADNMTIWTFQEYAAAQDVWGVLVTQLKAPPPASLLSATPSSAPAGTTLKVTIDGTSAAGSGFYDPGPGFPNRLSATVSGTGVTVNTVTYTNPTRITIGLTIDSNASAGSRTITIINPDGQSAAASGVFSINAPGITLSPVTLPDGTPTVPYSQTASASGGTGPYTFSIVTGSGSLPTGLSLNSLTGAITGIPTVSGTATFTMKAVDNLGNSGTRLYTMRIQTLLSTNISLALSGRGYDSTVAPIYPGGQWTLNTTLTNNGPPIATPLFFKLVELKKLGTDQDPAHPDRLTSADNGGGVSGDIQNLAVSSLLTGQSAPVSFRVGLGSRQPFSFFVELYSVLSGSAMTAPDEGSFKAALFNTAADTASGVPVLIGRYQLDALIAIPPATPPDSDFTTDLLSNVGVITGPGPQSRPAVAVDPIVSTHLAVASNDYLSGAIRVSTSTDGGKTWHSTTLSRTVNNQDFFTAQNPSLAFDSHGRLSVAYTLANLNDSTNAVVISESSDGINFNPPSALTFHLASDRIIDSRPVIAIKSGAGRYVAWDTFSAATSQYSINLVRSEEGGLFGPITTVVGNGLVSSPALALSKNFVYVGWDEWGFNSGPPYNTGGRLMIASSPSGARLNFGQAQEIAKTSIGFAQAITAMPEKGVGPSLDLVADPKNDRIYAAFVDRANGMRIRFARSGNRGKTWLAAIVSDDSNLSDQFSPAIAVDSDSNIKISYYDTTLSSAAEAVHVYLARSNKADSFDTDRVTTISSNDSRSNPLRDYTANLGDRTAAAMTDSDVAIAWTDTRLDSEDVFLSVVFDPDGESMTGTGKILSPAGAFPANPTLTGKAEFGFDAKFRKHSSVPGGDTAFNFVAGKFKFKFKSTSYDQFTIAGTTAQLKGSGKVNGDGSYSFLLTIIDGDRPGGDGVDRFRIKIVNSATGVLVYDNAPGASGGPQAITEGRIKILNN
ncbi:MAG TPA: Ig domain-containing protein [Terriglobia bacterium]|nr:Ig domain-containing protein [Terriglobia bacterium]